VAGNERGEEILKKISSMQHTTARERKSAKKKGDTSNADISEREKATNIWAKLWSAWKEVKFGTEIIGGVQDATTTLILSSITFLIHEHNYTPEILRPWLRYHSDIYLIPLWIQQVPLGYELELFRGFRTPDYFVWNLLVTRRNANQKSLTNVFIIILMWIASWLSICGAYVVIINILQLTLGGNSKLLSELKVDTPGNVSPDMLYTTLFWLIVLHFCRWLVWDIAITWIDPWVFFVVVVEGSFFFFLRSQNFLFLFCLMVISIIIIK
ncbi:hypothetical protein RFI_21727, partial [Reticulomyxa filosa]